MKKRVFFLAGIVVAALLAAYFISVSWAWRCRCFWKTARSCADSGQTVTMGTLFAFEWDEVYSDRGVYSDGRLLKEKYGLTFTLPRTRREDHARLLFFQNGKLIEAGTYPKYYLTIPSEVDKLLPETEVQISFGPSEKILVLTPAQPDSP